MNWIYISLVLLLVAVTGYRFIKGRWPNITNFLTIYLGAIEFTVVIFFVLGLYLISFW